VLFARLADSMRISFPPNSLAGACTVHLMKLPRPKPKVVLLGSGTCRYSLQQNVNIRLRPACRRYNFPAVLPRSARVTCGPSREPPVSSGAHDIRSGGAVALGELGAGVGEPSAGPAVSGAALSTHIASISVLGESGGGVPEPLGEPSGETRDAGIGELSAGSGVRGETTAPARLRSIGVARALGASARRRRN
jgi:hypothetical protein